MSKVQELKPCPFCGETKYLEFFPAYVDRLCGEPPRISCMNCALDLNGVIMIPGHSDDYFGEDLSSEKVKKWDAATKKVSEQELIREWNTRSLEEKHE